MGKKSRQKRQKQRSKPSVQPTSVSDQSTFVPLTSSILGQRLNQVATSPKSLNLVVANYAYVRGDMKRTFLILAVVLSLLVTVIILNHQTPWVVQLGGQMADFFQL